MTNYKRLIENKLKRYLKMFGAVCITGPKFCGKSYLGNKYSKEQYNLSDENTYTSFLSDSSSFLNSELNPILIDEWQLLPKIWTDAKNIIDKKRKQGLFIFTGSLRIKKRVIKDPGIGRFGTIKLSPLTIYESKQSLNLVSFSDLIFKNKYKALSSKKEIKLIDVINVTYKGGYPEVLSNSKNIKMSDFFQNYIQQITNLLIESNIKVKQNIFSLCLQYAAIIVGNLYSLKNLNKKLKKDKNILLYEMYKALKKQTDLISDPSKYKYFKILEDLFLIERLEVFSSNISSVRRITKTDKVYFCDPALALNVLNISSKEILLNTNSFGHYFENLVYKELKAYADYYDAKLYYYRENTGLEIDFIMKFEDGKFVAIEVKLSANEASIDTATKNLLKFKALCEQELSETQNSKEQFNLNRHFVPSKLIIITGTGRYAYKTKDDIYIIPLLFLKP